MVLCWLYSCCIAAMVSMGVGFQAFEDPKLVPDGVVSDGLDCSCLSESWLVSDWQVLGLKLDAVDSMVLVWVVVVVVTKFPAGGGYGA